VSEELKEFIRLGVSLVNREVDLEEYRRRFNVGENRTLLFVIRGSEEECGFAITANKLIANWRGIKNPTVTVCCDEDTFWKLIDGRMSVEYAWGARHLSFVGKMFLRDYMVLKEVFKDMRERILGGE